MRKILALSEKEFMSGIAPSSQVQNKGLWHKAKGINFAGDIFGESNTTGLLQAGPALTELPVPHIPIAWKIGNKAARDTTPNRHRVDPERATLLLFIPVGSTANPVVVPVVVQRAVRSITGSPVIGIATPSRTVSVLPLSRTSW